MADYSTQINALRTALAAGELTVTINGRTVTYRSVDDLIKSLNYFVAAGGGNAPRIGIMKFKTANNQ